MTVLKSSQLHTDTDAILDKALETPQYVERNGTVLVITKADLVADLISPWEQRAKTLESFYDPAKAW